MSPGDAAVAVRTFPRRWRAAFALVEEDQPPPTEAVQLAEEAVLVLASAAGRLGPAVNGGSGDALDRMATVAPVLAERIEAVDAETWRAQRSLLTAVTGAVDEVAAALRQAQKVMAQGDS